MTDKYPVVALLGWLPPIYVVGIVLNWGKPWCSGWRDKRFAPAGDRRAALWWPTKLYQHKKWNKQDLLSRW